jgi:hypothetical protein
MPFELKKFGDKYKVCKKDEPENCFSKKGLTHDKALKQMKAIIISELKKKMGKGIPMKGCQKMKGGDDGQQSPTFQEFVQANYPDYANLQFQGSKKVGDNAFEVVVNADDKIFFDEPAYKKLMSRALTREKWDELKKKRGNKTQKTYEQYYSDIEKISRARATRNLSSEQRFSNDKINNDNLNLIYKQYLEMYPDMQPTTCSIKDLKIVEPYQTTLGICQAEQRKYEREQQCSGFFGKITCGLTDVADFIVDNIPIPGVGQVVGEVYKAFGPPTSKFQRGAGLGIPLNKKLYEQVKKEIYEKQPKHSLYRSGRVIKEYIKRGGKFKENKNDNQKMNMPLWFKQDWIDIGSYLEGKIKKCGSVKQEGEYPLCRPLKIAEKLGKDNLKKMLKAKQELGPKPLITEKIIGSDDYNIKPTLTGLGDFNKKKYIELVKANAKKNGYDPKLIKEAKDGIHKFIYNSPDGPVAFGRVGYNDYLIYKLTEPEIADEKRKNYRARAVGQMKHTNNKYSPASLSFFILW